MKSVQWEWSCSTRTDRQTDTIRLTAAFRNLAEARTMIQPVLCIDSKAGSTRRIPKNQSKTEAFSNAT